MPRLEIKLEEEAERDICDAARFYHGVSPELSARFQETLRSALERLAEQPEIGRRYEEAESRRLVSLRLWLVRGFPYVVFYQVEGDALLVVSVVHASRDVAALLRLGSE